VLARRNDGSRTSFGDGVMTVARVGGTVGRDAGDLLICWDLVERVRQHGRVAHIAARDFERPDFQCFLVDPEMDLAPEAAFCTAMLAPSSGKQSPGLFADPPLSPRLHLRP
jgi:hypothetical protein